MLRLAYCDDVWAVCSNGGLEGQGVLGRHYYREPGWQHGGCTTGQPAMPRDQRE